MRNLLERYAPVWQQADPPAPPAGDPPTPPAGDPPTPPAGDPPSPPAAAQPYYPEGLGDAFRGANDQETIDRLTTSVNDLRGKIGDVPSEGSAYLANIEVADGARGHLDALGNDPVFANVADKALKAGVPVAHFQTVLGSAFEAAEAAGLLEPALDVAAEKAALVPEAAATLDQAGKDQAVEQRMNDNFGFLDALSSGEKPTLDAAIIDEVKAGLGDTANGHKFIEWARGLAEKSGDLPTGGGTGTGNTDQAKELERRGGLPENIKNSGQFNQASYDRYIADMKAFHGE